MPSLLSLIRAVLVLSVLQPFLAAAQNDGTVSIHDTNGYTSLRECARRIVSEDDWLKAGLSCPAPYYNFCYCRSDLGSVATAYISSCVFTDCRYNSADLTSVVGLYDAYCATATLSPGTTPKATTTSIGPGGTPVVVIPTTVIVETGKSPGSPTVFTTARSSIPTLYSTATYYSTRQATQGGGGGGGLSQSDKIALGTGISIPLAALIVAVYVCLRRRR